MCGHDKDKRLGRDNGGHGEADGQFSRGKSDTAVATLKRTVVSQCAQSLPTQNIPGKQVDRVAAWLTLGTIKSIDPSY